MGGNAVVKIRSGYDDGSAGKGALIGLEQSFTLSCNNDQTLFQDMSTVGGQNEPIYTIGHDERSAGLKPNVTDPLTRKDYLRCPVVANQLRGVWTSSHGGFMVNFTKDIANTLLATDSQDPPIVVHPGEVKNDEHFD